MTDDDLDVLADALLDVLADGRPRDVDEIAAALAQRGHDLGPDPQDVVTEVLLMDGLGPVTAIDGERGERYVYLPALLRERVFTHRVSELEVAHDYLSLDVDFEAIALLSEEDRYATLTDGTALVEALAGLDDELLDERGIPGEAIGMSAWLLPAGTLARLGIVAGELAAVTVRDDGFELDTAVGSAADPALPPPPQTPVEIGGLVASVCAADPDAFGTPARPLRELLEDAGYSTNGDYVAATGFDFDAWRNGMRVDRIADVHRLEPDEAWAVVALDALHRPLQEIVDALAATAPDAVDGLLADGAPISPLGPGEPDKRRVADALLPLAEPVVAEAAAAEILGTGRANATALAILADSVEPGLARGVRASMRWLRARALERLGRVVAAEQAYERVLTLDPGYPPALYALAQLASERGDAERGLALLRRAGAPADDGLVALLEAFRPTARTDIGRNQPCWCGSGRKYKVCHLHKESRPLEDRAAWLYQKAAAYLRDGPWRLDALQLAEIRSEHLTAPHALWEALNEPLIGDALLFEAGAFAEYLAERGVLLPEDERLLAEQWLLCERSVWEVESVIVGTGFRARDLRTGDQVDVRERSGSRSLKAGMLICARIVPAGETMQCFGGIEIVSMRERDRLLELFDAEYGPAELVEVLSAKYAPPTLQNTEGEPMLQCEAVVRPSDPVRFPHALDERYEPSGEGGEWMELVVTHGMQRVRASIRRDGDDFIVEANSAARYERALGVLREIDPDLQIVSERRTTAGAMLAKARAAGPRSGAALDPDDPAVAAALEQMVLQFEASWLDEPVPALGNVTPRQAADDPTRRPDLIRLLDSFPDTGDTRQMSPSRLRAALGLTN
jgi:tetratricopeptide (TPR) repeat protein